MNFVPIAAALILGICSAEYIPVFPAVTTGIVFIILNIIHIRRGNGHNLDNALFAVVFIAGIFLYHNGMKINIDHIDDYVTVRGVVAELPYESNGINRYTVYCSELEFNGEVTEPKVKIAVNSDQKFNFGDSVAVHGKLTELSDDERSYGFDTRRSYASRGITAQMTALEMKAADIMYKYRSAAYYSCNVRSKAAALIRRHYSGDIAAAMIAILTGDRHQFSEEYNDILISTATRRLFYPAYAHISLMLLIIGLFTHIIPKRFRDVSLLLVLLVYGLINSSNTASVKAAAVLFILVASKKLTGSGNRINSLALYAVISLLLNPMLIFCSEYVISVLMTLLIGRFVPIFTPNGGYKRSVLRFVICTVGIMPIGAALFGNLGLYSAAASLIFVPVIMLIIFLSPLFLINCLFASPEPIGWIIQKLVMTLIHIPILIDKLPFSSISFAHPSLAFIISFYSAAAALWYLKKKKSQQCRLLAVVSAGFAAVCLISVFSNADKLRLDFIDVGQGDAALIHVPFSGNILIDGGGAPAYSEYNVGKNVFVPYLTSHGVGIIQAAFVSHYHKDHAEGIVEAVKSLKVHNLFMPAVSWEEEFKTELEQAANENNTKIWYVSSPMHIQMDEIDIFVYPQEKAVYMSGNENDNSLLMNICYGEFNCMFTGDMSANAEQHMNARGFMKEAEILKIAHHGSLTSTLPETVDAVNPKAALIGCGEDNQFGFPKPEILSRLKGRQVYRTDTDGTIHIFADKYADFYIVSDK
ncbi:MAG: ComEC/Rec2 family competence protein [bacterium]|nr:ComEC/Rec2 family competence protein [bacterium]